MTSLPCRLALVLLLAACSGAVLAAASQAQTAAPNRPKSPEAPTIVPAEPQQTAATFGDWVVRCQRVAEQGQGRKRICEAAQALVVKGQQAPIAQVAFAPPAKDGSKIVQMVTVLLPTNIAFDKAAEIGTENGRMTSMTYRRCVPGGCFADTKLETASLRELRDATKHGELVFTDAAERTLKLPLSLRGLAQALDALAGETAR